MISFVDVGFQEFLNLHTRGYKPAFSLYNLLANPRFVIETGFMSVSHKIQISEHRRTIPHLKSKI